MPYHSVASHCLDFWQGFLETVLSDMPDAGVDGLAQSFDGYCLGNRHKPNGIWGTPRANGCAMQLTEHRSNPSGNRIRCGIHVVTLTAGLWMVWSQHTAPALTGKSQSDNWEELWLWQECNPADHRRLHHPFAAIAKKEVRMADRTGIDHYNPLRLQPARKPLAPHKRA